MKKVLFATLLVAAMGSTEAKANSFSPVNNQSEQKADFFCYWITSYCTVKEGNCTVKYQVVTKYLFGCAIYSYRCEISRKCDDGQGGGNN